MTYHVMIIPTLGCPSNCSYCWGSEDNAQVMDISIIKQINEWLDGFRDDDVHFTFHGGEPLLAGYEFYKEALPLLSESTTHKTEGFSLQSNLWLLTEDLAKLFGEYNVNISTSIDGPKEINDYQRGEGYFEKTMNKVELAQKNGVNVNFVCTFTSYSKNYSDEIYDFFKDHGYTLKIHAALPSLRGDNADPWALPQEEHGQLLVDWLDKYLYDLDEFVVMDLDHITKSTIRRRGTLCTFNDCMGTTLAVGADGSIYPCYRFCGMPEYVMGNVKDKPKMEDLQKSEAWAKLMEFEDFVDEDCKKCNYIKYCRGGCPYNALVSNGTPQAVDPQCDAYKMIFSDVSKRINKDFMKGAMGQMMTTPPTEDKPSDAKKQFSIMDLAMKK